uniref:Immunoglobulin I-set domain protein n=1 Tax=Panagrellus redivivus TaxID=6233 RepID=A0A7E4ZS77_PANRE
MMEKGKEEDKKAQAWIDWKPEGIYVASASGIWWIDGVREKHKSQSVFPPSGSLQIPPDDPAFCPEGTCQLARISLAQPLQDKRAIVGQTVKLEAQIEGHPDPVIKWLKDGHNVTTCPDYELIENGKTYTLVIPAASGADCGRFTIQAMNAAGIKQSTCMLIVAPAPTPIPGGGSLSIANSPAPPQTPVGPSAPFFLKELRHQPMKQGERAVFEARVVGVPVPTVEWLKDGKPLNNYRIKTEYDTSTGICALIIPQVFNEDVAEYSVKASNSNGSTLSTAKVLPKDEFEKWFVSEQQAVTKERKEKMQLRLQKQQQQQQRVLSPQNRVLSPQQRPQTLTPQRNVAQRQMERQQYLSSNWGSDSETGWGVSESETEPEVALNTRGMAPIFRSDLRGLKLTEGTDAILQCNILWFKNGRPIQSNGSQRVQINYRGSLAILKISNVTTEDSGEYTVLVDNIHGKAQNSAPIEVFPLYREPEKPRAVPTPPAPSSHYSQPKQPSVSTQQQQAYSTPVISSNSGATGAQQRYSQPQQQQPQVPQEQQRYSQPQPQQQQRYSQPQQPQPEQQRYSQPQPQQQPRQYQQQVEQVPQHYYQHPSVVLRNNSQHVYSHPKPVAPAAAPVQQQPAPPVRSSYQPQQHVQQQQPVQPSYHQQQQHHQQQQYYYEPVAPGSPYSQPQAPWRSSSSSSSRPQAPVEVAADFDFGPRQRPHPYAQLPAQAQYHLQQQYEHQQSSNMPVFQKKQTTTTTANGSVPHANGGVQVGIGGAAITPPLFKVTPKPALVAPGGTATFNAVIVGHPTPQITWVKANGTPIKSDNKKFTITASGEKHSLTIKQIALNDAQMYAVIAKNPGGAITEAFELAVQEPKKAEAPQFVGKFQSVTIYDGDSLKLYCKAVNDVAKMVWLRDGTPLKTGGSIKIENKAPGESILYLNNATMQDGGWYQCDASNAAGTTSLKGRVVVQTRKKLGSPVRERITLRKVDRREALRRSPQPQTVPSKEHPKFTSQLASLQLPEGSQAILDVTYTPTDDPNLKIAWLLNGKALLASSRVTQQSEFGHAVLEINPVTVFDHGEYTVVAVNQLGEARSTGVIDVSGYRSPSVNAFLLGQQEGHTGKEYQQQLEQTATQLFTQQQQSGRSSVPTVDRPNFIKDLRSQEIFEGQPLHLETKLTPINDPNLKVEFLLNGQPIQPNDHIQIQVQAGFVVISIAETTAADAGFYQIQASNARGIAETSATVLIHARSDISKENQGYDVEDVREIQYSVNKGQKQAPQFLSQLSDYHCPDELGRSYFEARVAPVNDPTLRVVWLKDGHPLPNANRIQTFHNFGFVSLTLHPTYPEDAGEYTCQLNSDLGEASSTAVLSTVSQEVLQLDPLHQDSLSVINQIEGHEVHIGPILHERPEEFHSLEAPRIARELATKIEVEENEPVHFEARIQPASDVKMTVEWYHNGAPLPAAHRFRPMFDFGYVALDILYAYPEDSGTYTMVAKNELGQAESSLELVVTKQGVLYLDPQHPEGLERIQELEQPKNFGLNEVADRECDNPPHFLGNLQDLELNENDDLHFELKLTPVHDPTMVVEWFLNDQPVLTGSRIRSTYDFGFISMDIKGVIPEDSGVYSVRARNALGEDVRQCQVNVIGKDAILSNTQHEDSIAKIQYLESLNKYGREEVEDAGPDNGPQFVQELPAGPTEITEGQPLHLECKVEPVSDNTLVIEWFRNGNPIPHAHRFRTFHDFGFVSLDILHFYAEDSGTYTCVARNAIGETQTSTEIHCDGVPLSSLYMSALKPRPPSKDTVSPGKAKAASVSPRSSLLLKNDVNIVPPPAALGKVYGQTQHPQSIARIAELEAPKLAAEEAPEAEKQAPYFVKPLGDGQTLEAAEADNVYLEAQIGPTDDNTLTYEWLLNDQPLMQAHRFVTSYDFGFAALNILYIYPEDSGTYTLVVRNAIGESRSSIDIQCGGKDSMLTDTFHPTSIQRITELEASRPLPEEAPDAEKQAPAIVQPLPPTVEGVNETGSVHFDAQFTPIDDNQLKVYWLFNGQPLKHSNRYKLLNDFGYASLDIAFVIPSDAGEYTLVVENEQGQATSTTFFDVSGSGTINDETNHPESLRRIQEIEAVRPAEPTDEDQAPDAPVFTQELNGPTEVLVEGTPAHFDCTVQPINDPNLVIEWFHNGAPLQHSSRIRTIHDFGYVALELLHTLAEDTGIYTCRATNASGSAETSFEISCEAKRNLYLDSQHQESWQKIQEMENRVDIKEPSPEMNFPPPQFTQPLANFEELIEGDSVRLECRLQPVNDPTLKVVWTRNGEPLPEANRFAPTRNMDYVALDIKAVYGEDSGVYDCRAVSAFGEAVTSANLKIQPTDALLLDTQHQESWNRIQEFESRVPVEPIVPELEQVAPHFVTDLTSNLAEFQEGQPIHFEGQIEPTNDNQLTVEWYHDGQPLINAHRFKVTHDFGYVALDILYAFAQDSGTYTCVVRNALGEAQSESTVQVAPRDGIYTDSQHPTSWQRIQEIEAPREAAPEVEPEAAGAPQILEPLESLARIEGQPAFFQTRISPISDSSLQVQWYKDGQPLGNSNRFVLTNDFGLVALHIIHTVANDAGTYTIVAKNAAGEASADAELTVETNENILTDVQHEESWRRIQEIEAVKQRPEEADDADQGPPKFVQQLQSVEGLIEGQPAHLEAQVQPITDPKLKIQWYHNGRPLGHSSRHTIRNDFGLVSLDISYALSQDIGDYRCVATNDYGEDSTEAHLDCDKRPSIITDTQHEESWRRIQEIEAPREAAPEQEAAAYAKPQFTQPLQSFADVPEGTSIVFEGRLIPVNDPNLQVQWFLNDTPLGQSNRFTMTNDFGNVALRISGVTTHDQGVYSCKAVNAEGAAISNASLAVLGDETLFLQSAHPTSLAKIQELEGIDKFPRLEYPEDNYDKPVWVETFENVEVEDEGAVVVLSGIVEPANDPALRIEWLLNGVPLLNANRFRQENNFGQVSLTIVHVLPHDSGVYSARAYNDHGEVVTSGTVKVAGYESILRSTQHPTSWDKIQELERPKIIEEVETIEEKEKPRFLTQLESAEVPEGTPIHLEATFQPARDSSLVVEWQCNGHPLGASQLIKTRHELGWASLDIAAGNPDHEGVYTLNIANSEGDASSSASIKVAGIGSILGDTQHEESWRRIQEIEAPREKTPDSAPPEYEAPSIQVDIKDIECEEGDPSRFEATILPTNDPTLQIQWIRNGIPLQHGSKYAISQDFGFSTLAIGYTYPEDEGVYQVRAVNAKGEAVSSATLKCTPKDSLLLDTQHEESWRRIQEIEAPKEAPEEVEPEPKPAPRFTAPIQTPGELHEGQPAHFETTVEPVDDPNLKIQWYLNGAPVAASNRAKIINDFGWIILNLSSVDERDSGVWECVATNEAGEARESTELNVLGRDVIYGDTQHEESWRRIQEIEAPREAAPEQEAAAFDAPQITVQLVAPVDTAEGDSAHLAAQYTPVNDPKLRVEWYKDGAPLYHANRYKMVSDFGFAILDILYLLAHDSGEYTVKVINEAGEASSSVVIDVGSGSGLILDPQNETKAKAVEDLEESLRRRPEEEDLAPEERIPVWVEPLSAPVEAESGDRVHFSARYEPVDDNQLQIQWFVNGRALFAGSRVKTLNDFGYCVLEISPVYPEDSGEYTAKVFNKVGEAVTSTSLQVEGKETIITQSQLPSSMAGAQARIDEIENRKREETERPEVEHGPPKFTSQLQTLPELREGSLIHLDVQVEPVADPRLKIEWFHNGNPVGHSSRMKTIHDFGFVVLELSPAEPQDTGTWTVRATNDFGSDEVSTEISVSPDSGISYEWVAPGERRERITQLEDWINRPRDELDDVIEEFDAPVFTEELQDLGESTETDAASFMCVLEPIGDPSMKVEWQHNGHAIPFSNRIQTSNDFGVITLNIKHLIAQDSGEYSCVATNSKGEARTTGTIIVQTLIESEIPTVVQPLVEHIDSQEGESVHLECRVTPINDPKLTVQWRRNGAPLPDANRFKTNFEFGFATLDLLYAYPEDNGDYELVVTNDKGEASTTGHVVVIAGTSLDFKPQAPGSTMEHLEHHLRQFTQTEINLTEEDAYDPNVQRAPEFKAPLTNVGVDEGEFARFETQLAPINDPYLKVEWYKNQKPVLLGNRFRNTLESGYVALDLLYALPDDTGEYTCVATNKFGQAMISAKLACQGLKHIITDSQIPQGVLVSDIKRGGEDTLYWQENTEQTPRQKQPPQFTIRPRNIQATENEPARFECAVIGNPKPRVLWYINGNQALHGHRYKLTYDGIYYITITHTKISDAGEIVAIAKNSEGEVLASANLDVFQRDDFRQQVLKSTQLKTADSLRERETEWKRETLGSLGDAFTKAPKASVPKLLQVERTKAPFEPLETEELVSKFIRPRDDQFYEKLSYVEREQKQFENVTLEPVSLRPGKIDKYQPPTEEMEKVNLRGVKRPEEGAKDRKKFASPPPDWADGVVKLGKPAGKIVQVDAPEPEVIVPARDQVSLKQAKPKPAPEHSRVTIAEERAKLRQVQQGPQIEPEKIIPAKDQVQFKQKYAPNLVKQQDHTVIEATTLKDTPEVVKKELEKTSISKKPMPTKLGASNKAPPTMQTQLKPIQGELGRAAKFSVAFAGDQPINVKWFHNGKELRSAFDTLIRTTATESTLDLSKLKKSHEGEYTCRLENVAGQVESTANLIVAAPAQRGVAPDFRSKLTDQRIGQGATGKFSCSIIGEPRPAVAWFKDGKPLPNDARYTIVDEGNESSLQIDGILAPDAGVYEVVAKNPAGEARCKAKLNIVLSKTGKGAEAGPKLEAPRFLAQIQPLIVNEGQSAEFRAQYSGAPEPTIRWYRNNEPIKPGRNYETGHGNGEAWLKILSANQDDVAEYKVDAINPAGKAATVANLVVKPPAGKLAGPVKPGTTTTTTVTTGGTTKSKQTAGANGSVKQASGPKAPQFLQKLSAINARAGENVKFVADIDGSPLPTVTWQFNGRPLTNGRDHKISVAGNKATLEIVRAGPANAGTYQISLKNATGTATSDAKLTLQSR